jgi:hypothetical protein
MDFTSLDWCLVCGGYEAMALEKSFVTSDKVALREFYRDAAVYTTHSPQAVDEAVVLAFRHRDVLSRNMRVVKRERQDQWRRMRLDLETELHGIKNGRFQLHLD